MLMFKLVAALLIAALLLAGCVQPNGVATPSVTVAPSTPATPTPAVTWIPAPTRHPNENNTHEIPAERKPNELPSLSQVFSGDRCAGSGTVNFTSSPMNLPDIGFIQPLGLMVGDHVTPVDHLYITPLVFNSPRDAYNVYAIANGTIVSIQHRVQDATSGRPTTDEYRVVFEYSCTFYSYYDLLTSLTPDLLVKADFSHGLYSNTRIPVTAGQLIGKIGGQTVDFSVFNEHVNLTGFINQTHYNSEVWKIHVDNPFPYFVQPIRENLEAKLLRTAYPQWGKIDYDQDGKLVGNWFEKGTNGYGSLDHEHPSAGHLAITYDYLDPTQIRVSTGDYAGQGSMQFGVVSNAPDPAGITVASGLVTYTLAQFEYYRADDGQPWDRKSFSRGITAKNVENLPKGIGLFQLIDNRTLQTEFFPEATPEQITRFDDHAKIYVR